MQWLTNPKFDGFIHIQLKRCAVQEEGPVDVQPSLLQHFHRLALGLVTTSSQVEQLEQRNREKGTELLTHPHPSCHSPHILLQYNPLPLTTSSYSPLLLCNLHSLPSFTSNWWQYPTICFSDILLVC